jgi:hypothetical protein
MEYFNTKVHTLMIMLKLVRDKDCIFQHPFRHKIGENCGLGQNVVVGPDVIIGNNCKYRIMFQCIREWRWRTEFSAAIDGVYECH